MGRKKRIEKKDLFESTRKLLIEKGYEGFHFKALAEQLSVGRSTIYEYYANKDELIFHYIKHVSDKIYGECKKMLEHTDPLVQLQELLTIFLKHGETIHEMIQVYKHMKASSNHHDEKMDVLEKENERFFEILVDVIKCGQRGFVIRNDLQAHSIASVFFSSILIPNTLNMDIDQWSETLFTLFFDGIKAK
ncbi:TetR/AcrR family transcriptional regulator [Bacillus sp. SM2101]|uniref:TetR/AcrR family transcriptional regulator n=1 Tax=Bacillaceae TaxID=186817 RepID=UPI001BDEFD00|nr:TetR/AcrR family transcriptional regulator [Bacillus sp. SM2101]